MSRKKTTKQFKKEVYNLVKDEYTVLGEYINNKTKLLIRHNKCGNEYKIRPKDFLRGIRCSYCANNYKRNTEEFKKEVYNLVKDEYTVLGEYINNKTKLLIRHNKCGNEYMITPNNFLKGARCPYCYRKEFQKDKIKWDDILFKEKVKELVGDEYTVLGNYINSSTKILIKHNKCGHEYEVLPLSFLGSKILNYSNGHRCSKCSYKNKKSKYKDIDI